MSSQTLSVISSNATFTLLYDTPAFALLELGNRLFPDLFSTFREFGISLADIRTQGEVSSLTSQAVTIFFGTNAVLRLSFERAEFTAVQPTEEDVWRYSSIVEHALRWMRERAPSVNMKEHELVYNAHTQIAGGSSRDLLASLVQVQVEGPGQQAGHGLILHWYAEDRGQQVSLSLDHSLMVRGGLFLGYSIKGEQCPEDIGSFVKGAREELFRILNNLNLSFEEK